MIKKLGLTIVIILVFAVYLTTKGNGDSRNSSILSLSVALPIDCFTDSETIEEADKPANSSSKLWWVSSGAWVSGLDGVCSSIQGSVPSGNRWRLLYARNNPLDTDNGYHPQNILRLVRTVLYKNVYQQVQFRIARDNLSASPNRNASNGVLFFVRYINQDNLYYVGLRVDGTAVIKKKLAGVYTTLAQAKVYPGTYNRDMEPNLMPHDQWIGMRTEVINLVDGGVLLRLYIDKDLSGNWQGVLNVIDQKNPITGYGYGGLRSDFMDVNFRSYVQRGFSL